MLLDRLDLKGILPDTAVSCALVPPPSAWVVQGSDAFRQACGPELLRAVDDLANLMANDAYPSVVNMSVGTHVGPHNGGSPLEEAVAARLLVPGHRFVLAAAGNDGGRGLAARRRLRPGDQEYLTIRTGPRCKDLLVEFWWREAAGALAHLTVSAELEELKTGAPRSPAGRLAIGPGTLGTLTTTPAGTPQGSSCHSLFQARCRNDMSCIALALTSANPLPPLEIAIALESSIDVVVNAWIVLAETDPQTAFVEGGQEGSVCVPASDPILLSVAGVEDTGKFWRGSSRGPAAAYNVGGPHEQVPLMAHRARYGQTAGTSFASPRAAADAAVALANPNIRNQIWDSIDLLCETYGINRALLPAWNERFGYHKQTQ